MGKYNKARFASTTFRRDLLRELDEIAGPGESRNDVIERLIKLYHERITVPMVARRIHRVVRVGLSNPSPKTILRARREVRYRL